MFDQLRQRALSRWAWVISSYPGKLLLISFLLAAVSIGVTLTKLTFQADRNDLLSKDLEWNQNYIQYRQEFEGKDRIVVVVKVGSQEADRLRAQAFIDRLDSELSKEKDHINKVWSRIEAPPVLVRLLPWESFDKRMAQMVEAEPLLRSKGVGGFIGELTRQLQSEESETSPERAIEQIQQMRSIIAAIGAVSEGADAPAALKAAGLDPGPGYDYLTTDNGRLMVVDIDITPASGEMDPYANALTVVRKVLAKVKQEYPGLEAGLTGIPVLEADETLVTMRDSTRASIAAVIMIAILMSLAFGGLSLPLFSVGSLLVGIAWSFGFLTIAIGHLQLLSVVFTVILLGLGIDFAVHLLSRYELVRHRYGDDIVGFSSAMRDTLCSTGPGIITGALTTAAAFSTTLLTDFQGMAEMGLIAGVGLLLCAISVLSVLPATMRLLRPYTGNLSPQHLRWVNFHADGWLMPFVRKPWVNLCVAGVLILIGGYGLAHTRFDNNLLNMMPMEMDSAQWIRHMEQEGQPIWDAVMTTDRLEQARQWTAALRAMPAVKDVGGIGWLWPADDNRKLGRAAEVRRKLQLDDSRRSIGGAREDSGEIKKQLGFLRFALDIAINRKDVQETPGIAEALHGVREEIGLTTTKMESVHDELVATRFRTLTEVFSVTRDTIATQIDQATQIRPLVLDDLPVYLHRESVSRSEPTRYVVKAYPKDDVWEPKPLAEFISEVRRVNPMVTGSPVQIHESGLLMQRSYRFAGSMAVVVVFILMLLDFRSMTRAVLCMVPVGMGFVLTFGVMWLADVAINPANLMVLPLLFGIGVASGVHMMHRYIQSPVTRPLGLAEGTGKSIILTSLTTIIAFATMIPAEHRGIASLGFVLAVGITMTLIVCLTVMPALLELLNRIERRGRD